MYKEPKVPITYTENVQKSNPFELSVVVPVGNLNGEISELESWVENDPRIEIILVLDNSDISTKLAIHKSKKINSTSNIEILEASFGNPGDARNFGMSHARGKWICFVDADDTLNVFDLMELLDSPRVIGKKIVVGNYEIYSIKSKAVLPIKHSTLDELLGNLPSAIGLWRFTFLRQHLVARNIKFPSLSMAEDQIFFLRLQSTAEEMVFTDKVLYRYFVGGAHQLTRNPSKVRDLQSSIPITMSLVKLNNLKFFDVLPSQMFALLLNNAELSLPFKVKYIFRLLIDMRKEFGISGVMRVITYPLRRLN